MSAYNTEIKALHDAIEEAERFIDRAKQAIEVLDSYNNCTYGFIRSKETAAAKRASMDLTRALVYVRK